MASLQIPSPSPQNPVSSLLARFEYEAGQTSVADATKVLMVEWEESADRLFRPPNLPSTQVQTPEGDWMIEWKGRREILKATSFVLDDDSAKRNAMGSTVVESEHLALDEPKAEKTTRSRSRSRSNSQSERARTHRLYFLLPPGAAVPPTVSVTFRPRDSTLAPLPQTQTTPTLPAIFPAPLLLSATSPSSGKKGVLHTLWAKARVGALKAEIAAEERERLEGIGLEMAKGELDWICENFGVGAYVLPRDLGSGMSRGDETAEGLVKEQDQSSKNAHPRTGRSMHQATAAPSSPLTPHSPSSSDRLLNKMAGLRVGTSPTTTPSNLQTPPNTTEVEAAGTGPGKNPLSPDEGDVAVSAFAEIRGSRSIPQPSASQDGKRISPPFKIPAPIRPPQHAQAPSGGISALGDVLGGPSPKFDRTTNDDPAYLEENDDESEGLFAVAMSPRSPETKTSPFSFSR